VRWFNEFAVPSFPRNSFAVVAGGAASWLRLDGWKRAVC
jgi:hypothetical protein